jgi:hypothetical protein
MKRVDAERFGRWLKDPVTRMYLEALEELKKELVTACGDGGCYGKVRPLEEMYHFYQGSISAINQAATPHHVMAEMIKEGADE